MAFNNSNHTRVGVSEFVSKAIRLDDEAFEKEMRLDNNDKNINEIDIPAWTRDEIEAYER
jgi:hypothetical protein